MAIACAAPAPAFAQAYPDKPVRILVGFSPGGFTDVLGRLIGQKLIGELGAPFSIGLDTVTVTASIGVSTYPADATDSATLLRHADAAM